MTRASGWVVGCCAHAQGATRIAVAAKIAPARKRRGAALIANATERLAGMTTSIQTRAILPAFWHFFVPAMAQSGRRAHTGAFEARFRRYATAGKRQLRRRRFLEL